MYSIQPGNAILANYGMDDVHMVVLSACETAMGGPDAEGIEVPGISFYFLNGGAKAVMASLWLVNDASTSLFMQQFYTELSAGNFSKAEARRRVQMAFIQNEGPLASKLARGGFELSNPATARETPLSHPYYWAPFILIGNGL